MKLTTLILAAGKGTRMRSDKPKVLHEIAGKALLKHVYDLGQCFENNRTFVLYGHGGEQVKAGMEQLSIDWILQEPQLGTGHAVLQAVDYIDNDAIVLVLYGDVPLLQPETIALLLAKAEQNLALLTVDLPEPKGYGRIVRNADHEVVAIVEEKDASAEQRDITEVNTGILAVRGDRLKAWLAKLDNNNAQGEYYLTDIIAMAVAEQMPVHAVAAHDADEVMGVNDKVQLAHLERVYQRRQARQLMQQGVTLRDPERFDLRGDIAKLGHDVEIDVNVLLQGRLELGDRVTIGANCVINNAVIGDDVEILANSIIEHAVVGKGSRIGPFARLRPGADLAEQVHIGNFVEIKKTTVAAGSKINHLSYIGDTEIGSGVNVGAGTITCNYDGVNKFRTVIGDRAFIGSNSQLVAPVTIGQGATIGAGSTITKDAPVEQLTLARAKQVTVSGWQRPTKKES
ncbi:MAG: bifunctional UDP-N-acetylglucosamine diphosphorylase/glucosamine-1-phosphate N-acetyltransferase GlmU [Methylococcales bacterium]|nr:bifunctional UDP-N-acetylglucosamine diphosphorylase/glucosamine-1-phosphate N-acetyltransferase GlmU [Methylococcales bacterium]